MPTFKEAKRADRLAAIQQMRVQDVPPHWWDDPELSGPSSSCGRRRNALRHW